MGESIGAGDIVECIRVKPAPEPGGFRVGGLYTVTAIHPLSVCSCDEPGTHGGIEVAEVTHPKGHAWCVLCFRPISRWADFARTLEDIKASAHQSAPIPDGVTA